jgi:hypothetical protein
MNFKKMCTFILSVAVLIAGSCLSVHAWPVPDTGQTKCYDDVGNEIPCPAPGARFHGQDGNYTINPMSFTLLSGGIMVKDNVTGLIWENKQAKDGEANYTNPHDADNTYTWYDSNPATNGGYAGTPGDGTDTEDFINALNSANFGGYSDWRLPTINELDSIVDLSIPYPGPTIRTAYFPNTQASFYWSSTTYATSTDYPWVVSFLYGNDSYSDKSYSGYVRAVRGGQ